jgi:leucyl-tRNA synthetase
VALKRYDHNEIEQRWQGVWEKEGAFRVEKDASRPKYYVLEMFPYPSGKIHMGHVRNYSIGDVIARYLKMRGYNVLHPMGWDSFGLPAENAAIQKGIHPKRWTIENIDNMRCQLKRMGLGYDWSREVATCRPDYYRWNQWFFIKFLEKGLAYKKRSAVNWCPDCATVLANEQVEDGRCWRCESIVVDRDLDQWFFKITDYKDELLEFTKKLPGWPERVLVSQQNWIGKSTGAEIDFMVEGTELKIAVFTTRPDTLYGATFMSMAPESKLVNALTTPEQRNAVADFISRFKQEKSTKDPGQMEKEGVFTGAYCINPATNARMPIYVANFVLMEYGTGAVMAVPAHDQRDFEFARKYDLPIKVVIHPEGKALDSQNMEEAYTADGVMCSSGEFDGLKNTDAMTKITAYLESLGKGGKKENYRLRDWGISRQRYWGCPIPIIYCDRCGAVPVPEKDLPVVLPDDVDFTPGSAGGLSPLATSEAFVSAVCPKCKGTARRETDTMDTFVDSSWYFLRYASPNEANAPFDGKEAAYWMPVEQYIGGIEHAVMHLLYARFFTKACRDLGLITFDEPFTKLLTQGMVCKETIKCPEHGYLFPEEAENGKCRACGKAVEVGRVEKMSKSKKNVIDPDRIMEKHGADTTRLFSLFAAPPERDLDWSDEGVEGAYRFLMRVWRLVTENSDALKGVEKIGSNADVTGELKDLRRKTHDTIRRVTRDIEDRFHFNTAISSIMELVNAIYLLRENNAFDSEPGKRVLREALESVVLLMSPFAPHASEELWADIAPTGAGRVFEEAWPAWDDGIAAADELSIVVQINGKVRSKITAPTTATQAEVEALAMKDEKVVEWTTGKKVKKVIYVPAKLLNVVVG